MTFQKRFWLLGILLFVNIFLVKAQKNSDVVIPIQKKSFPTLQVKIDTINFLTDALYQPLYGCTCDPVISIEHFPD